MSTIGNVKVPDSLLAEVERAAHAENRSADEVVRSALARYLEESGWQKFVENNDGRARAKGIGEDVVERLISEVRRESERGPVIRSGCPGTMDLADFDFDDLLAEAMSGSPWPPNFSSAKLARQPRGCAR